MTYTGIDGVPDFECFEWKEKSHDSCLLIPVINEGERIRNELNKAFSHGIHDICDIVILDGGSTDGSVGRDILEPLGVNSLLIKTGPGKQGAQLRMGLWWAFERQYRNILTIDGNDKDSIESVPHFIEKLNEGYDFVQGSRFIKGGRAVNTPVSRLIAVKMIHAPIISLTAGQRFTDTTNAFRGYSARYLQDPRTLPLRDVFTGYELLAYLSVRATQLGYKACEIPVARVYPEKGKVPTKISPIKGNADLMKILIKNAFGAYKPKHGQNV